MQASAKTPTSFDEMLAEDMGRFYADPLGFVLYAYEWGKGELAGFNGPDDWQRAYLEDIGRRVKERNFDGINPVVPIRKATASGHGIGKSALTAWLVDWIMSTRPFCKGTVTANTFDQLETKTWAQIAKWTKLCITGHWFEVSTSSLWMRAKADPENWRVDGVTCREENAEAFAGQHAANSTPFYIFDEASAIPDKIWEVAEGGTTDGEPMWFVFGNPTRNTGKFRECFGKDRSRWITAQIDSRKCKLPNKILIQEWEDAYGEDSDFFRVRVKGEFPRAGSNQFIPSDIILAAAKRELPIQTYSFASKILGVDVARFGSNQTVFTVRQGLQVLGTWKYRGKDTMWTASRAIELSNYYRCDAEMIDDTGVGGGVTDRMRQLGYYPVPVNGSAEATDPAYFNKRAEMWGLMRDWLKDGGAIPDDPQLKGNLEGPEYGFSSKGKIQLEKKEDMAKRGLESPDDADSLALTFAYPVNGRSPEEDEDYRGRSVGYDGRSSVGGY